MRVLVTGGAGFIGSHLSRHLLRQGEQVSVLDDLSTGSLSNIADLIPLPGFEHVVGCVTDLALVETLVATCDFTVHLAAAVGVRLVLDQPIDSMMRNIHGTEVVLDASAKHHKPMLLASSSEVYGKSRALPFREDGDLILGPTTCNRWSYACSKMVDEWLTLSYWEERDLPVVVCRIFNTVGPHQAADYGMVLPRFVRQALAGAPITVHGTGQQSRCFTHVADTVQSLSQLMREPRAMGQVVNIGSDDETTILELAKIVRELTASDSEIVFVPYSKAYGTSFEDISRRIPDLTKLVELTGYRPSTSLRTVIFDVLDSARRAIDSQSGTSKRRAM